MMTKATLRLLASIKGILAIAAGVAGAAEPEPEPLVVGMELEYPPFEFVADDGQPDGVSVRMAQALGEYLRRPVEIQNVKFDALITALKTGSTDLIAELKREGQDIILSTHEMGFAREVADEVAFLCDGKLVTKGSGESVFDSSEDERVRQFLSRVMRY